jgi:drug/metabolite transporter (DMT)-like permease
MVFRKQYKSATLPLAGILLADACSKTHPIFTKLLYKDGWTPLSVYFVTLVFIVIILALHEFMAEDIRHRWALDRSDVFGIGITSLTGGVLSPILFMVGLQWVTASDSVVLNSSIPLFIVLFAVLLLGEKFTKQTLAGGFFLLTGTGVILWRDILAFHVSIGAVCIFIAALCAALTTILHKKYVTHRHLDSLVFIRSALSLAVVALLLVFFEPQSFVLLRNPPGVWTVLGLSAIAFIVPYFLYFRSIRHVRTTDVGVVLTAGPIIGVLMAHVFLGEAIRSEHLLSLAFIAVGIVLINVPLTKWRIVPSRLMEIGPLRR